LASVRADPKEQEKQFVPRTVETRTPYTLAATERNSCAGFLTVSPKMQPMVRHEFWGQHPEVLQTSFVYNSQTKEDHRANRGSTMKPNLLLASLLALPLLVALPQGAPDLVDVRQYGARGSSVASGLAMISALALTTGASSQLRHKDSRRAETTAGDSVARRRYRLRGGPVAAPAEKRHTATRHRLTPTRRLRSRGQRA